MGILLYWFRRKINKVEQNEKKTKAASVAVDYIIQTFWCFYVKWNRLEM